MPAHLTSDRGVQFTSAVWQDLCQSLGMAHHQTSAYHPQANGLVERFHRQLKDALRPRLCGLDWAEHLLWVLLGLRAAPKEDSAVSSAELVLGSQLVLPGQFLDALDWSLQDLGRVRQQMTAPSGGLPTRPLRGSSWTPTPTTALQGGVGVHQGGAQQASFAASLQGAISSHQGGPEGVCG